MKKYIKLISLIIGLAMLGGIVYATATTARDNKSSKLPWQGSGSGTYNGTGTYYAAHNVGTSNEPEFRFSFVDGTSKGPTGVVKDSVTGLMWQSEWSATGSYSSATMNWTNAKTYCADLELGGYTDWRLPNIKELSSIVDFSKKTPSVDTSYFNFASGYYWSSTTYANNTDYAWLVTFYDGHSSGYDGYSTNRSKAREYYVVCTR